MIEAAVLAEIQERLAHLEVEQRVRILLAIESGSRAWGFASPNSDYDVRFVYAREASWYQAVDLEERRDVLECEIVDDIDLNGWDVRKALRLYWKSNPAFVEWIQSPITYLDTSVFRARSLAMLPTVYAARSGVHHYLSMARKNYRGYLQDAVVPLKKYFYVLRPLLAARWVQATGGPPPIEFEKLLPQLETEPAVLAEVQKLLARKRTTPELGRAAAVPFLNEFIEAELAKQPGPIPERSRPPEVVDLLNDLFHAVLQEGVCDRGPKTE